MKTNKESIKKRLRVIYFIYKEVRTDIEADLFYPVGEWLEDKVLQPLFSSLKSLLPAETRNYIRALFFSISNRSHYRFSFTLSVWIFLFLITHLSALFLDLDYFRTASLLCFYTAALFLLIEILIQQYHIVRIFGKVKDRYIYSYDLKRKNDLVPLTNGKLIPNNLWFYKIIPISEMKWSDDLSDIQAHIHGEQYTLCRYNIRIYLVILAILYLIFL